jgi:hypothetical protein
MSLRLGPIAVAAALLLVAAAPAAASDPVIAAAGDIACDPANGSFDGGAGTLERCRQRATSDLLLDPRLSAVLPLGDNQYYCGSYDAFLASYDLSWGRVKAISHPVAGNHEYLTSGGTGCDASNAGAAGYFRYFGASAGDPATGWYSFDLGAWHLIALNSNCTDVGGCGATSPQGKWLKADLAAHPNRCVLAYWHIPLFSTGNLAGTNVKPLWVTLQRAGADVVLSGHDHSYQRFPPQTASGAVDVAGVRQFVVGTGGANLSALNASPGHTEARQNDTFGVLEMTLHPGSYEWRFVPVAGSTYTDSGAWPCHHPSPSAAPPVVPGTPGDPGGPGSPLPQQPSVGQAPPGLRVAITAAARQRALRRRALSLQVVCSNACAITASARFGLGAPARSYRFKSVTRNVGAGSRANVRLALPRAARAALRRALARHRKVVASVVVSPGPHGAAFPPVTRRVRLIG